MEDSVIKGLGELFSKGYIEKEFEVFGYKFKLKTLSEKESIWRDKFVDLTANTSFLSSRRIPTLAIAIKEISDKKVEDIFIEDVDSENLKTDKDKLLEALLDSGFSKIEFDVAKKLLGFLSEAPPKFIDKLWKFYNEIESEAQKSLDSLSDEPNFFRPGGREESSPDDSVGGDEENESSSNGEESKKLSNFQWALLYKYLMFAESTTAKNYLDIAHKILGTGVLGDDRVIPLAAFANADMYKKLIEGAEDDEDVDEYTTGDVDLEAEDIFNTDIEAMITDEDREKMKEFEKEHIKEMENIERLIGVNIIEGEIENGSD